MDKGINQCKTAADHANLNHRKLATYDLDHGKPAMYDLNHGKLATYDQDHGKLCMTWTMES